MTDEIKTENPTSLDIEKFSPPVAELNEIVSKTKLITMENIGDLTQLSIVKESRKTLQRARIDITKKGKELRQDALSFQKAVITREKELIEIIEPEEKRLTDLINKADAHIEMQGRVALIPERRESLAQIDKEVQLSDDELTAMDNLQFQTFCNDLITVKNENARVKIEEDKERLEKEKRRIAREKEIEDAKTLARKEEREKADRERKEREKEEAERKEREAKEEKERIAREEKEAKERVAREEQESKDRIAAEENEAKEKREREERERKEKEETETKAREEADRKKREERERLEAEERYQNFLKRHGYVKDSNEFVLVNETHVVRLYKQVAVFNRVNNDDK